MDHILRAALPPLPALTSDSSVHQRSTYSAGDSSCNIIETIRPLVDQTPTWEVSLRLHNISVCLDTFLYFASPSVLDGG